MPVCTIVLKDVRRGIRRAACGQRTTLVSAVFGSLSRLEQAVHCGLKLSGDKGRLQYIAWQDKGRLQYIAGWHAAVPVLSLAADKHGMLLSSETVRGAIESGRVNVVDYLIQDRHCELPVDADHYTARAGDVNMLQCLRKHGCVFKWHTCSLAATAGHLRALKYLWSAAHCTCALEGVAHCTLCNWKAQSSLTAAAQCGSIEMAQWLQQQSVALTLSTMQAVARAGQVRMCEYLHTQQCPWPASICLSAAAYGQLGTLSWLYEHGYFCNANDVLEAAAEAGAVDIMEYLQQQGVVPTAAQLTDMLITACHSNQLKAAQWLREQGATWPTELLWYDRDSWSARIVAWARANGCTLC
jgi:hypothetical protein